MFKYSQSLIEKWKSEIDVYLFCLMYGREDIELFESVLSINKYNEFLENSSLY